MHLVCIVGRELYSEQMMSHKNIQIRSYIKGMFKLRKSTRLKITLDSSASYTCPTHIGQTSKWSMF